MAGVKTRRGLTIKTRPRYVIGTDTKVNRVQLRGKGKKRFVWISEDGLLHPKSNTELRDE